MTAAFEELDYQQTQLGELILRRRRPIGMPDEWVYEVKLAGRFLMSSLVADSERELARAALQRVAGSGLRVLVGGLGLGCTAAAVLDDARVAVLEVVELLEPVVAWHRRGLVPLGARLGGDRRCRLVVGDALARLRQPPRDRFDAILVDVDDGPADLLDDAHAAFWSVEGLRAASLHLRPGGAFAVWTNGGADAALAARLRAAFAGREVAVLDVTFDNPLLGEAETNAIYCAYGRGPAEPA